jgi:hypothetical protein
MHACVCLFVPRKRKSHTRHERICTAVCFSWFGDVHGVTMMELRKRYFMHKPKNQRRSNDRCYGVRCGCGMVRAVPASLARWRRNRQLSATCNNSILHNMQSITLAKANLFGRRVRVANRTARMANRTTSVTNWAEPKTMTSKLWLASRLSTLDAKTLICSFNDSTTTAKREISSLSD